jgi:ribosomal-protein-alanine N-acetyltransferase
MLTSCDDILIRPMLDTDIAAVYAIECKAYEAPWTLQIIKDCVRIAYDCWVLTVNYRIYGYVIMSINPEGAHVLNIAVDPAKQHCGYGRRLMRHLIAVAIKKKVKMLLLEVRISNHHAIKLYESLGFNQVDVRQNYYPKGNGCEDGLVFALELLG